MPYNVNRDSGFAERQSWVQVDDTTVPTLTGDEGTTTNNKDKRFASLVYTVNPSDINISGAEINVDAVGLNDSGTVKLSGDQLKVFDQGVIDAINNQTTTVELSSVGLDDSGIVKVSGDQLKVFDQGVIDAINNQTTTVELSAVGINDSGDVGVTPSGQLEVYDSETIAKLIELNIRDNYSRIIEEDTSGNVYFAHAPIGTSRATSGWRIYKLDEMGNRSWADNGKFSQPTNIPLSGHTFSY